MSNYDKILEMLMDEIVLLKRKVEDIEKQLEELQRNINFQQ